MFTANSPERRKALRRFGDRARSRCVCSYKYTVIHTQYIRYIRQTERLLIDYRAGLLRNTESKIRWWGLCVNPE